MSSDPHTNEDCVEELAALQQRVASLERMLADAQHVEVTLRQKIAEQEALLHAIPALVFLKGRDHRYITVNQAYATSYGLTIDQIVGKTDWEIFPPAIAEAYQANDEAVMASGQPRLNVELPIQHPDGSSGWLGEHNIPYRDAHGQVIGMVGVAIDITARKQAEEALRQSEANLREVIAQQERLLETIKELSTPVLPISDHVLILPLVGHIDTGRGEQIMEAMLAGVERYGAEYIIVDITGVPVIDTAVANHLLQAARAVHLLGAQCVLVGISPEIAQTLVQLGVDLTSLITLSDLQAGISYALSRSRRPTATPTNGRASGEHLLKAV